MNKVKNLQELVCTLQILHYCSECQDYVVVIILSL